MAERVYKIWGLSMSHPPPPPPLLTWKHRHVDYLLGLLCPSITFIIEQLTKENDKNPHCLFIHNLIN